MGLKHIIKTIKITGMVLSVVICIFFLVIVIFSLFYDYIPNENKIRQDYIDKMINLLNKETKIKVNDVFEFEFNRAYVFDDCYLSGEDFASYYELDISIEEVETGLQEYNNRIVFVDDQGEFIYEFVYESYILNPYEDGMIIYPDTELELCESKENDVITFKIHSTDYYNYFNANN